MFATIWEIFRASIQRNKTIIRAVSLTFFGTIVASVLLTDFAYYFSPRLFELFNSLIQTEKQNIVFFPPYTTALYFYIFLNNIGHFWNPVRMFVWVPLLGALALGLELLLNGVLIGSVATVVGIERGIAYPILGLVPHGIVEVPALILEFTCIIRWQITIVEAVIAKITGEKVDRAKIKQGLKDTVILALASIILFAIAAAIETYITPRLLGL